MKDCDELLGSLSEQEKATRKEVESMQDKVQGEVADIPSLHDEKS